MFNILTTPSPFGNETGKLPNGEFEPGTELLESYGDMPILVIGAGGLGCEILKDLALSGFKNLEVVDMDTIDVSNLNRQFLFRKTDVGKGKAEVAAAFIQKRVPTCKVKHHNCRIQSFDASFYSKFKVIISGLDNIEARRWLNSLLVGMVQFDEDGDIIGESLIPFIDGGTEGFRGQARLVLPRITACFECSLDSFPPQKSFPMCTIAETPRMPEHCIAYAMVMQWEREFPTRKVDSDSPTDLEWIYQRALERATTFGIEGVTYFKTKGVVKNIIPAIASTNAIISAACVLEAFKLVTLASQSLNTYLMYMGKEGCYSHTFEYEKKDSCLVCSDAAKTRTMNCDPECLLRELMVQLADDPCYQLKKPSIAAENNTLYMQKPPALEAALRPNLGESLSKLIADGEVLTITDPMLFDVSLSLKIAFSSKRQKPN